MDSFWLWGGAASGEEEESGDEEGVVFVTGEEDIQAMINELGCPLCHYMPDIEGARGELGPALTKASIESSFKHTRYQGKAKNLREYVVESILKPSAYVVYNKDEDEPYPDGLMPKMYREQMTDKALNKIVDLLLSENKFQETLLERTEKEAKTGNTEAQIKLAYFFEYGVQGAKKNYKKAFSLYSALVKKDNVDSLYSLARLYAMGLGTKPNAKKAFSLYSDFVERKKEFTWEKLNALYQIGLMHYKGLGTPKNDGKALNFSAFEKSLSKSKELNVDDEVNRVIVRIINAVPSYKVASKKNDFDEFLGYDLTVGCNYTVEIENHSSLRVKLASFYIKSHDPELQDPLWGTALIYVHKVLEVGQKIIKAGSIDKHMELLPKVPSDEKKNKILEKFSCGGQLESLYLDTHPFHPIIATFANATKIKDPANEYIIGQPYGDYPLEVSVGGM